MDSARLAISTKVGGRALIWAMYFGFTRRPPTDGGGWRSTHGARRAEETQKALGNDAAQGRRDQVVLHTEVAQPDDRADRGIGVQ